MSGGACAAPNPHQNGTQSTKFAANGYTNSTQRVQSRFRRANDSLADGPGNPRRTGSPANRSVTKYPRHKTRGLDHGSSDFLLLFPRGKSRPATAAAKGEKKLVPLPRRTPELPQKIIHYKYRPVGYSPVTKVFHYIIYTPMAAGRQKLTRRGQLRVRLFVCIKSGPSILDGPPHLISAAATHTPPRHGYPLQPPGCCP